MTQYSEAQLSSIKSIGETLISIRNKHYNCWGYDSLSPSSIPIEVLDKKYVRINAEVYNSYKDTLNKLSNSPNIDTSFYDNVSSINIEDLIRASDINVLETQVNDMSSVCAYQSNFTSESQQGNFSSASSQGNFGGFFNSSSQQGNYTSASSQGDFGGFFVSNSQQGNFTSVSSQYNFSSHFTSDAQNRNFTSDSQLGNFASNASKGNFSTNFSTPASRGNFTTSSQKRQEIS